MATRATACHPAEVLCRSGCDEYRDWLDEDRGLAKASIRALLWEGRHFLSWYTARGPVDDLAELDIRDIDVYFEMRAPGLRRRSLKDVAERLRSLMWFLHRTGRIGVDPPPRIIAPVLHAYESIPSALSAEQISAVLKNTRKDRSPIGYRDYAILLLLSTGLREGEITQLQAVGHRLAHRDVTYPPFQDRANSTQKHHLNAGSKFVGSGADAVSRAWAEDFFGRW